MDCKEENHRSTLSHPQAWNTQKAGGSFQQIEKYEKWEPHDDTVTQETITKKSEVRPTTNEPQTDHIVQPGTIPHSILIEQRNIPADNIPPDLAKILTMRIRIQ